MTARMAVVCGAGVLLVLVASTAAASVKAPPQPAGVLAAEYPRLLAAARSDVGSPDTAQSRYDAARSLQIALPRSVPRSCEPLLRALHAVADANIAVVEAFDQLDRAGRARASARVKRAEDSVARVEGRCRNVGRSRSRSATDLLEPESGAAFAGTVRALVPSGATRADVRVDGGQPTRYTVGGKIFSFRVARSPGPIATIELTFLSPSGRVLGVAGANRLWRLPPSAWRRSPPVRRDAALSARLAARATGFAGYSASWVADLGDGVSGGWNEDARFPAASTVKLGVIAAALASSRTPSQRDAIRYDVETIGAWSSNLAANRLLRLLGRGDPYRGVAPAEAALRRLGASSSTYPGEYRAGTSVGGAPVQPPLISQRVTTARDLGTVLETIQRVATGDPVAARRAGMTTNDARLVIGSLLRSERRGDNVGLLAPWLPGSLPVAQKQGWISSVRHTAAIIYGRAGPVVCVVLTYKDGLRLTEAQTYGRSVAAIALERASQ